MRQDDVTELFDLFDAHFWGWIPTTFKGTLQEELEGGTKVRRI